MSIPMNVVSCPIEDMVAINDQWNLNYLRSTLSHNIIFKVIFEITCVDDREMDHIG